MLREGREVAGRVSPGAPMGGVVGKSERSDWRPRRTAVFLHGQFRCFAMARPRKPPQLKALAGTARKDRVRTVIDLPLVEEPPAPPAWLTNCHALDEWARLAPILLANKLLTTAGLVPLAHLCALHGAIVAEYAEGKTPTAALCAALRGLMGDFGLTPVAQSKVSPAGTTTKPNPFLEFVEGPDKRKRRGRRNGATD